MLLTFKIHIQYGFFLIGSIQFIENYISGISMNLNPVKFTEELAKEITTWKYEGDYSIYNLPSWDEVIKKQIVSMALDECKRRYPSKPIILEVRSWNKRAIRCYESQGFKVINRKDQETYLGTGEFFIMEYIKK